MSLKLLVAAALASVIGLSGCATYQGPQEQTGMVIGGILGGLLGAELGQGQGRGYGHGRGHGYYGAPTSAIIAGTLAGAAIGWSMDETDRLKTAASLETVRTGVPSTWRNPDNGNQYVVTPTKTHETASDPCREYTIDAVIDGKPDGSWKIQG